MTGDRGLQLDLLLAGDRHSPVVYFILIGDRVKIGTTTNLLRRVGSLSVSLKEVRFVVPGGRDVERRFHERFDMYRISRDREWFYFTGKLRDFLSARDHRRPKLPRPTADDFRRMVADGSPGPITELDQRMTVELAVECGLLEGDPESLKRALRRDRQSGRAPRGRRRGRMGIEYDCLALAAWQAARPSKVREADPRVWVTVEHAVASGHLDGEPESLKRALRRDRSSGRTPESRVGPSGIEYDREALAEWQAARPSRARATVSGVPSA